MSVLNEINLKVNVTSSASPSTDQDNDDPQLALFVVWGIVLPLIATAGLVGNILTIIVLWRREMNSTTILYLRGLVITDTGILIGTVITLTPISCANYLHGETLNYFRHGVYPYIHAPGYYIIMTLQQCNVWITVSVAIERYIAICHPFRAARLITKTKTLVVIIVIVVTSLIYNIPHYLAYTTGPCDKQPPVTLQPEQNITVNSELDDGKLSSTLIPRMTVITAISFPPYSLSSPSPSEPPPSFSCLQVSTSEFGKSEFYNTYRTIMYSIIIYIIPFLGLLIINSFLIRELMMMQQRRSGTNIHDENEANLSLVLVLIVIVFIFCQTPGLISQFDFLHIGAFLNWLAVSNLLFTTNSAVNFLIYTAFGRKFRRVLLRVFRHIFRKNRRQSQSGGRIIRNTTGDFETFELSSTNCQSLRRFSCYRKQSKVNGDVGEDMPLNTLSTTTKKTSNGFHYNINGNNGARQAFSSHSLQDCTKEHSTDRENIEKKYLKVNTIHDVRLYAEDTQAPLNGHNGINNCIDDNYTTEKHKTDGNKNNEVLRSLDSKADRQDSDNNSDLKDVSF